MRVLLSLIALLPLGCAGAGFGRARHAAPTEVTIRVVDEHDAPVAGAEVEVSMGMLEHEECCHGWRWQRTAPIATDARGVATVSIAADWIPNLALAARGDWPAQVGTIAGGAATIVIGPPRPVGGHLATTGCPANGAHVQLWPVLPDDDRELVRELAVPDAIADTNGDFVVPALGPGRYHAMVDACGVYGEADLTGRDAQIAIDLPAPAALPATAPLDTTAIPADVTPACQFVPWTQDALVSGDFSSVAVDPWCRLVVVTTSGDGMIADAGGAVALGTLDGTPVVGPHAAVARVRDDRGRYVMRTVSLPDGATVDRDETDVVTLAPHGGALAYLPIHDLGDGVALDVRFADGRIERVARHVLETAWTDDDRLAYLQSAGDTVALHLFDPAAGSDAILPGDVSAPSRYGAPITVWATRGALVVLDHGRLDQIALADLSRTRIADSVSSDYVRVDRGAITYVDDGPPWFRDATTGAATELPALLGGSPVELARSPAGELVLSSNGRIVVGGGGARACDQVLGVAGDIALCADGSRTLAVPLDAPDRAVGLSSTILSPDGRWAAGTSSDGSGLLERTDGSAREGFAAARGVWAPDRDVLYFLSGGALIARDADADREVVIAPSAQAFAPLPDGRVVYAVPHDGIRIATQ